MANQATANDCGAVVSTNQSEPSWMKLAGKLILAISSLCFAAAGQAHIVPEFKGGITPAAIFSGGKSAVDHCLVAGQHDLPGCLVGYYKNHGASKQAIKFLQLTSGYIQKITRYGNISIILAHVMAADHTQQIYLVNTQGDFIDPDYPSKEMAEKLDRQFQTNEQYHALLKADPMIFYFNNDLTPKVKLDQSGQVTVLFSYRITNCMACAPKALGTVAFNFNRAGDLQGVELLSVKSMLNTAHAKED